MKIYVGIDLHSTNSYFAVVNENGNRLFHKRFSNDEATILSALKIIEEYGEIAELAIESTYNWYWLVDLLREHNYYVHLGNPAAMKQYKGLKVTNDKTDAYFLAELLRLKIFPKCWICPREDRPVRDLLRARGFFVAKRTSLKNSLSLLYTRYSGRQMSYYKVSQLGKKEMSEVLSSDSLFRVKHILQQVHSLDYSIVQLEKRALKKLGNKKEYMALTTVPGIGPILALTIMLETGEIGRFKKSGNYTSYCRCVDSHKTSNGKNKGVNNKKNGNKYLAWAYSEAAVNAKRYSPGANQYWQRKSNKTCSVLAYKALAAKLTKACYYIIKNKEVYEEERIFR